MPLGFVIAMTALKDLIEDYRRHMMDVSINSRDCYIVAQTKRETETGEIQYTV